MTKKLTKKPRILAAMSGGVDSSTAVLLLKRQGYEVSGAFLNLGQTNYKNALAAAKKVARKINIPLKIIDLRKEFKKEIINYFLKTYQAGDTPNPCVVCNQKIKFGLLFKLMDKWKFDYLTTGHYIKNQNLKIKNQNDNSKSKIIYKLYQSRDRDKDQSYFLWGLTQKQLFKLLFPLGDFTKEQVKKMAERWRLPYLKKESQDICFLPFGAREFLRKNLKMEKGEIMTIDGKIIGCHYGLPLYTIGQKVPVGGIGPYYVFSKNPKKNQLIVVHKNDKKSFHKEMILKNVNWISNKLPRSRKVLVRTRYRQPLSVATLITADNYTDKCGYNQRKSACQSASICVLFDKGQKAVAPGQSAVFYGRKGELLGGGVII